MTMMIFISLSLTSIHTFLTITYHGNIFKIVIDISNTILLLLTATSV